MSNNNTGMFRAYSEDCEKIKGFMAENNIDSNSKFMHYIAEHLSAIEKSALVNEEGVSENDPDQLEFNPEDYEKIKDFMAENNLDSDYEFTHFIAESLSALEKIIAPDGDEEAAPDTKETPTDGDAKTNTAAATILAADSIPADAKYGLLVNGKFYPTLFPDPSWEQEDRYNYFNWFDTYMKVGLRYNLQKVFDDVRRWEIDHNGDKKEKTPYGYFKESYLFWHSWPVYPELWPNIPPQEILYPECQEPEYLATLRKRFHDAFAGTNLRHRDKYI